MALRPSLRPLEEPLWRPCTGTAVLSFRIKSKSNLFFPKSNLRGLRSNRAAQLSSSNARCQGREVMLSRCACIEQCNHLCMCSSRTAFECLHCPLFPFHIHVGPQHTYTHTSHQLLLLFVCNFPLAWHALSDVPIMNAVSTSV
jgi:hypothetical protein